LISTGYTFFTKEFWIIFIPTFVLVFVFKYNDLVSNRNEWKKIQ
jgi:hypothetical protein